MEYDFFKQQSLTAEELRKVLPVNVNVSLETLAPALRGAVKDYAEPVLGKKMLTALQYYYYDSLAGFPGATGFPGSNRIGYWLGEYTPMKEAILELQSALLRLAYYDSFAQLAVMISDTGLSDQQGEQRVYRYQADALRRSLRQQGAKRLNALLLHCENHESDEITASAIYSTASVTSPHKPFSYIQSSPLYSLRKNSFIRNTTEFQQIVDISSDALLFHTLRPYITRAEQVELVSRVGDTNKNTIFNASSSAPQDLQAIKETLQRFVAFWAVADALPIIGCRVTPDGALRIADSLGSGAQSGESLVDATPAQLTALTARYRQQAEEEIGFAIRQMKSAALLHLFSQDELGPGDDYHRSLRRDNRGKRTFLA